ncbi:MAG: FkbM family methyltransferase [Bacteroidota bacterium]
MQKIRKQYYKLLTLLAYFKRWGFKSFNIYRSLRRQSHENISSIKIPGYQPIYFRSGTSDIYSFEHIFAHECYRLDAFNEEQVKWVIDCGANVGHASRYFAKRYPEASIIAIEPDQQNVSLINKNIEEEERVTALHTAIWSKPASLKIQNADASNWAFRVTEALPSEEGAFTAISMSDVVKRFQIPQIDIIKIDIEGTELELFRENYSDWLSITKCIFIELHERFAPGCTDVFMKAIDEEKRKYKLYSLGENQVVVFEDI